MLLATAALLCLCAPALGSMRFPDSPAPLPIKMAASAPSVSFPTDGGSPQQQAREHIFLEEDEDGLEDNSRFLNLLPSVANDMQVGLDLRLPFLNVPYARVLSGLFSGGAGSLLSGSGTSLVSLLIGALLFFPKILASLIGDTTQYRGAGGGDPSHDELLRQVNKFMVQHNVDFASCVQTALCVLGEAKHTQGRHGGPDSTAADVLDSMLNLASIKKSLNKAGLREARSYGASGGSCESFGTKCPVPVSTWRQMISNLNHKL